MPLRRAPFLTVLYIVCLAFATLSAEARAESTSPSSPTRDNDFGSVVSLTPFEVTAEKMEFSRWKKISAPHFILYTDSDGKEAARLVKQMEMMHQAAQFFLRRKSRNVAPLIVVLPTERSDWIKIGNRGGVDWAVATALVGSTRRLLLVQYDWQSDGLSSFWALEGLYELEAMNLDGPLWFERGIADFFRTVTFTADTLTIGKEGFGGYLIKRNGWMEWPRLFRVTTKSPEFTTNSKVHDQYENQCGVFVHYLLTNTDPSYPSRLLSWAAFLEAENPPTEESFKTFFNRDWKTWGAELDRMLDGGHYTTGEIKFPPAALKFSIVSGEPAAREMKDLFILAQILNQKTKDSELALDALLAHGLKTDLLDELLVDACERRHRPDIALQKLRGIIAAGSSNAAVYSDASALLFRSKVPDLSLDSRLGQAETDEIRKWCSRALELDPLDVDANETLAWTEAFAPTVDKSNLETVVHICRALNGNARTDEAITALAVVRWRGGARDQARTLAERVDQSNLSRKRPKHIAADLLGRLGPVKPAESPANLPLTPVPVQK